jgi:hypothetical protein
MAYSFSDLYRPLRISMRINGAAVGLACGLLLLWSPERVVEFLRISENGSMWPVRLAGAALTGLGVFLLMASGERIIHPPVLFSVIVSNGLIAVVLLLSYLQGDLAQLSLGGSLILVCIVALCLIGAVLPVRYLRAEYRAP